ncbi:MAG: type I methionyl aminopeptidase [Candidatus Wildermuthbacteria bacterium]|nr:type I methionyl aminopeptidase [Candidatus Wildermuthbacteria bacterium]
MISLKSPEDIAVMREGGRKLASVLQELQKSVRPGITTKKLDEIAETLIEKSGAQAAFKGYEKFPGVVCASVNDEVVHAIPSSRVLKEGDILTLDIGLIWQGFYLDMARTFGVGKISFEAQRLIRVTKKAMKFGLKKAKAGNTTEDIGNTIQRYVESQGYNVVRDLCGHGIGKQLHEDPQIPNYGKRHKGEELKEGMVICIEPMVTAGDWKLKQSSDKQGFLTRDGSLSCHVEDTIAIMENSPEVLTE